MPWLRNVAGIALIAFLPTHAQGLSAGSEIVNGELGRKLDEYMTRITPFGFSGVLLVAKDGEIILNKGYGMAIRSQDTPNTSQTVLNTGSLTKQFTAAGIMKLEMMGKLATEDPIGKHVDGVPEDKQKITLHHLLTHTSGVIGGTGDDYTMAEREATVRKILEAPLEFQPGERFEYSNAGYTLLAAIIEMVSGTPYETFLHKHLFKPAGMGFTGYRLPKWDQRVVAHWYVGTKDNATPLEKPYPSWNVIGNGEILSTTDDMYKWHMALMGERVLSEKAKRKLYKPFLNDYAYGWDALDTPRGLLIQHDGGSGLGSSAEMRRYVDAGVVTVVMCNQSYRGGGVLFSPIRDKIETLAFGGDVRLPPAVLPSELTSLAQFEGTYRLESGGELVASLDQGVLTVTPRGQKAINALISGGADLASYHDANQRSAAVFEAALRDDYQPFEAAFDGKVEGDRVRGFIEMRMESYSAWSGKKAASWTCRRPGLPKWV
jgi:CubicO group peptidase (beta-lactamase class C family)